MTNFRTAKYMPDGTAIDDPNDAIALSQAEIAIVQAKAQQLSNALPARIYISAPLPPAATTAAVHTYDVQIAAKRAFYGVRFVFTNYDTAAVMAIAGAKCASPRRHLLDTGANIAAGGGWSGYLTVAGATTWNVPAAKASLTADHVVPGFAITDFYPLQPQARTDSATYGSAPLVRCRALNNGNAQKPYSVSSTLGASWNGYTGNGGLLIGSNMTAAADQVTDPTLDGTSVTENGGYIATPIALFAYTLPGKAVFVFGDSLFQGNGSTVGSSAANGFLGWPLRIHCQAPLIDTCNFAVTGETTVDSIATMKSIIGALDDWPGYVALKVYSPNDGIPTQALIDATWGRVLDACSWLRTKNITPILFTSSIVNSWTAGQKAFVRAQNARATALAAANGGIKLVDMYALTIDPADATQLNPAYYYDGTHFNDAGHQAIADVVMVLLA